LSHVGAQPEPRALWGRHHKALPVSVAFRTPDTNLFTSGGAASD